MGTGDFPGGISVVFCPTAVCIIYCQLYVYNVRMFLFTAGLGMVPR